MPEGGGGFTQSEIFITIGILEEVADIVHRQSHQDVDRHYWDKEQEHDKQEDKEQEDPKIGGSMIAMRPLHTSLVCISFGGIWIYILYRFICGSGVSWLFFTFLIIFSEFGVVDDMARAPIFCVSVFYWPIGQG